MACTSAFVSDETVVLSVAKLVGASDRVETEELLGGASVESVLLILLSLELATVEAAKGVLCELASLVAAATPAALEALETTELASEFKVKDGSVATFVSA